MVRSQRITNSRSVNNSIIEIGLFQLSFGIILDKNVTVSKEFLIALLTPQGYRSKLCNYTITVTTFTSI